MIIYNKLEILEKIESNNHFTEETYNKSFLVLPEATEWIEVPKSVINEHLRIAYLLKDTMNFFNMNSNGKCSYGPKASDSMIKWAKSLELKKESI
ncbi:hypothetical protein [Vibrio jasicida]|uniref:hypothetical protein n=1 Tax=Vibrio jasicida TaxID=766224 RepID=UPI0005F06DF1|nr:hypothetical protein [Vibrio jasicida]